MELLWSRLEGQDGHTVAYKLLAKLAGDPLPEIARTPKGKPYFPDRDLPFSISHTSHHAFCCLSSQNIGIDAEECNRRINTSMTRFLSPAELTRYESASDKQACLLRLWVLKESYAKLTGRGLGNYLKNTDFDPNDPRIQIIDGCYVAVLTEGE